METRKLSLQEMEITEGGSQEVACGIINAAALGSLYFGPAGWLGAIGMVAGAYLAGCYQSTV